MSDEMRARKADARPSRNESDEIRLPEPSAEDLVALRAARRQPVDLEWVWRVLESMEGPTMEELRRRPITEGVPFRWDAPGGSER